MSQDKTKVAQKINTGKTLSYRSGSQLVPSHHLSPSPAGSNYRGNFLVVIKANECY
jgi:hypothetical protein